MPLEARTERIFGLDLMRAVAILMVLSSHILWIYGEGTSIIHSFFQVFGYLGVEVFFVLSGFLIGSHLLRLYTSSDFSTKTVLTFIKRRWFRTLPNYYLYLLINIGIAMLIGYNTPQLWTYFFFLQNMFSTMLPFFPESWSLSVEETAYIIFPVVLFLFGKGPNSLSKASRYLLTVLLLILLFTANRVYYHFTTTNTLITEWNVSLKDVVVYRVDAILYGALAAWIAQNKPVLWEKSALWAAGLGWGIFLYMFIGIGALGFTIDAYPAFWNIFYLPLTSILAACFLPLLSTWKTSTAFYAAPVRTISLISYSVYLIHYGVVLQLMKFYFPTESLSQLQKHGYTLVFLLITFIISWLNYRYFEKPVMDLRDKI